MQKSPKINSKALKLIQLKYSNEACRVGKGRKIESDQKHFCNCDSFFQLHTLR
jgi:hypothetical protein